MSNQNPILISGAGLSSLLLAQRLHRASIPFLLYERDSSLSFRAQGYRLRLSSEGLDAIEEALGPELFQVFWDACSKTGGGGFRSIDARTGDEIPKDGERSGANKAEDGNGEKKEEAAKKPPSETLSSRDGKVIGISRGDMRRIFLTNLPPTSILFSNTVTGYMLTPHGIRARFSNNSLSPIGTLLVCGEGISSKTAKQLSHNALKVYDTGARGIHGLAPSTAFRGLGEGVWRIVNDKEGVFAITNVRPGDKDDPTAKLGWTMGARPGVIQIPNDDYSIVGTPAAKIAKSLTANWSPKVRALFDEMVEPEAAFWKITCSTPSGVRVWENQSRVTVIGDAVHAMTPAGGIGANTAVRDAALLGRLLVEAGVGGKGGGKAREGGGSEEGEINIEGITAEYERQMRVYASEAVGLSYGLAKSQFGVFIDETTKTV